MEGGTIKNAGAAGYGSRGSVWVLAGPCEACTSGKYATSSKQVRGSPAPEAYLEAVTSALPGQSESHQTSQRRSAAGQAHGTAMQTCATRGQPERERVTQSVPLRGRLPR